MPCDPVITVAPDVLFFECFSADESSYGCLTVDRDAFARRTDVALGTTNVDYSWALVRALPEAAQLPRDAVPGRPGRLRGADAARRRATARRRSTCRRAGCAASCSCQAAMSLPMRRVPISREGLYNVLAFLEAPPRREEPAGGPLRAGARPAGGDRAGAVGAADRPARHALSDGPRPETIRIWGRDRLAACWPGCCRSLDEADVYLLGTGLPSFWSVRMGEMRLLLGLSGWTANDWTGAGALDQLAPPAEPSHDAARRHRRALSRPPGADLRADPATDRRGGAFVAAGLNRLALLGQVIHDLPAGVYRWRQIMPVALSLAQLGPENPETVGAAPACSRRARSTCTATSAARTACAS